MKALLLLCGSLLPLAAITHEVHPVYQALSFHGTDMGEDYYGETVQAKVMSFPAVVVGAMPEALVDEIGNPHRIPGPESYQILEANLLVITKISLTPQMTEEGLVCTYDLSRLCIPEEIEISIRTILQMSIESLKKTLGNYYREAKASESIVVKLTGLSEKNISLKNLTTTFVSGK